MIAFAVLSLLLPTLVSAHGYVAQVTIDGTVYKGNPVGTTPTVDSVIRQVNTNSPVKGATNPDINCGAGAQLAKDVANANPGSTVEVLWSGGTSGTSPWPHNTGPIMHYMAKCDGSCASYNSTNAEWFKISELGLESNDQTWYQAQLQSGSPATVTIPSTLAAGNYLLRSEIIALQLAVTEGGAEFYPACIQLSVGGSQTGGPTSSEEVTFPGGYTDTDPGILTPNIYNPPITYTFPGPPVAAFVSGGSSSSGSGSGSSASPSSSPTPSSAPSTHSPTPSSPANVGGSPPPSSASSSPTPTPTSGGSGSTCRRKRSLTSGAQTNVNASSKSRMHRRRLGGSH